ncbi:MAG: PilZ domain-containing protein [Thermodesulfobacteriota bacterium]
MSNNRVNDRVPLRYVVMYGPERPPEKTSYTTDLSETGLCIKTVQVYSPGTKLYLNIEVDDDIYACEGVVIWAKKVSPNLIRTLKGGMGIKFTRIDEALLEAYQRKKAEEG